MDVECPVCRRPVQSPTTLRCGHSQCLAHRQPCPLCRWPNNSPGDATDVVLNAVLANAANGPDNDLHDDLTCHICYQLFYEPVTAPCQHTFCAKCLQRSLDHSNLCPLCRAALPHHFFLQPHALPVNRAILSLILNAFPVHYSRRSFAVQSDERLARLRTPIFVCQLSFPGVRTHLHLFEPRYRLMLRRCLQNPSPSFGMVMAPTPGAPHSDYGTILDIKNVHSLPDGRIFVETCGSSRFRILDRATLDGYMVAHIEPIHDVQERLNNDDEDATLNLFLRLPNPHPSIQDLVITCKSFLDRVQRGAAPWVVQRLSLTYGPMPSDPALFSFWVALVLPIEEQEKAKLLPIRSPTLRLVVVVKWIEDLDSHWWFANGCSIQ